MELTITYILGKDSSCLPPQKSKIKPFNTSPSRSSKKSPLNVRKTAANCDDLIANIRANGLMLKLCVYPGKNGRYQVFAGGRSLSKPRGHA
jgi:hypothetical protein